MNNTDGRTSSDRFFSLDARLAAVASLVPKGCRLWDVGSDHGRLPVWLIKNALVAQATASDIGAKPLDTARRTAKTHGVDLHCVLCDGLPPEAENAADVIVIAGMGGETIAEILKNAPWARTKQLILQPMTSQENLREFLYTQGYAIAGESYVRDGRRGYVIIKVQGEVEPRTATLAELYAGAFITDADYMRKNIKRLNDGLHSNGADRAEIEQAIDELQKRKAEKA